MAHGTLTDDGDRSCGRIPGFQAEREELLSLVDELAVDLDACIRLGGIGLLFTGAELRQHYADLQQLHPASDVLADVRRRWAAAVVGDALPLVYPLSGSP